MTELETQVVTQANDAEAHLLGAVLAGQGNVDDLARIVEAGDFYAPYREEVWAAILRVHNAGSKPDMVSVRISLDEANVKHDPLRLYDLAQLAPMVADCTFYADQVAAAAGKRRIQAAATKVNQLAQSPGPLDQVREQARQAIDEATTARGGHTARTVADILDNVIDTAQFGQTSVLGTGWPDVDRIVGGFAPGRLVVIGARPGVGKSLFGTNVALHFAHHHGHAVFFASLEMPELEVGQRMLASFATANLTGLQMGTTDEKTWLSIAEKSAELGALPITIDDAPGQTVTSIRAGARDVQRARDDLAVIVVDYLQLVTPADTRVGRVEQIGEISRGLKLLARETGACVLAMAQLNREGAKHSDGKPRMTDLRESGAIEADADQVILLHQPDDDIPELEVIVDKNRHGPKGVANLQIQGHYAQLASVAWQSR